MGTMTPRTLADLRAPDSFILADPQGPAYYLFSAGTSTSGRGVEVRRSNDLAAWSSPVAAFGPADLPRTGRGIRLSAPRVREHQGRYLLTATAADPASVVEKGSAGSDWDSSANRYLDTFAETIVVAEAVHPTGPFRYIGAPVDDGVMARDATCFVDGDGAPWLLFAHDWVQKIDGTIEAMPLDPRDVGRASGPRRHLFRGSTAAFYRDPDFGAVGERRSANADQLAPYVAEAPTIVRAAGGSLIALWTTERIHEAAGERRATRIQMQAVSRSGIAGPWSQGPAVLPAGYAGGSVFDGHDGRVRMLASDAVGSLCLFLIEVEDGRVVAVGHDAAADGHAPIDVADTTAPHIWLPSTRVAYAGDARHAIVDFCAVARDAVDGDVPVAYSSPPGSRFGLGRTTVEVTARDAAGNVARGAFVVDVRSGSRPVAEPRTVAADDDPADEFPLRMPEMPLHDPYVLADAGSRTYYLYTAAHPAILGDRYRPGVMAYRSRDLVRWSTPTLVYTATDGGAWWDPTIDPWAPEVHVHRGRHYLFTTLHSSDVTQAAHGGAGSARWIDTTRRATIIAVADTPDGPFRELATAAPVTPENFMTLDGTLYTDPEGRPFLVYAHEWVQKQDGTMEAIPLSDDLAAATGEPLLMFRASEAPVFDDRDSAEGKLLSNGQLPGYVTDGAHLHETPDGSLVTTWTSYRDDRYVLLQAISRTGNIAGPWEQLPPLSHANKGHSMQFRDFAGNMLMIMHNHMGSVTMTGERAEVRGEIYDVALTDRGFEIIRHRADLDGAADEPLFWDPPHDAAGSAR